MPSEDDGFMIPPPEEDKPGLAYEPPTTIDAAWTKYIIEFNLPKELQDLLIQYTKPIVDLAAKSNILRREIPMHLLQYDLIWQRYRIFMHKGKFDPKLYVYKELIRHALELQLNRSVEGWQGELLFTRKFDVTQRRSARRAGRLTGFFKRKEEEE